MYTFATMRAIEMVEMTFRKNSTHKIVFKSSLIIEYYVSMVGAKKIKNNQMEAPSTILRMMYGLWPCKFEK